MGPPCVDDSQAFLLPTGSCPHHQPAGFSIKHTGQLKYHHHNPPKHSPVTATGMLYLNVLAIISPGLVCAQLLLNGPFFTMTLSNVCFYFIQGSFCYNSCWCSKSQALQPGITPLPLTMLIPSSCNKTHSTWNRSRKTICGEILQLVTVPLRFWWLLSSTPLRSLAFLGLPAKCNVTVRRLRSCQQSH